MKERLVRAFYLLQGSGNLIFGLLYLKSDPVVNEPPLGIALGFGGLFLACSLFSFLVVLFLAMRRSAYAEILGILSCSSSMFFYGILAGAIYLPLALGQHNIHWSDSLLVLLSVTIFGIVVLNVVALIVLVSMTERK